MSRALELNMTEQARLEPAGSLRAGAPPSGATAWNPGSFAEITQQARLDLITASDAQPILPDLDLWDSWPLQHEDGRTVSHGGRQWWFFLSAPRFPDPSARHDAARIRLASLAADGWQDHGGVLDPASSPGSREWAGSAVLLDDGVTVILNFTAAGRRGEPASFEQRIFACQGILGSDGPAEFAAPTEQVVADGNRYVVAREAQGAPGLIKGFRDPAWFRDPATGLVHLLFTASAGWDAHDYNGVIGLATRTSTGNWVLGDPLVTAVGVNNELERPHILFRGGQYYLFWSTQGRTFSPDVDRGPNGLYAMTGESLGGPWRAVNGTGLVAANPASEPTQSYSWWVTGEGEVWSFIDHWGMAGRSFDDQPELLRSQFGGTPGPIFTLSFSGDTVLIAR
jgi:levansucrase